MKSIKGIELTKQEIALILSSLKHSCDDTQKRRKEKYRNGEGIEELDEDSHTREAYETLNNTFHSYRRLWQDFKELSNNPL